MLATAIQRYYVQMDSSPSLVVMKTALLAARGKGSGASSYGGSRKGGSSAASASGRAGAGAGGGVTDRSGHDSRQQAMADELGRAKEKLKERSQLDAQHRSVGVAII